MEPKNFDDLDGMRDWLRDGGKLEKGPDPNGSYRVCANDFGNKKVRVIKFIRERLNIGLKEALEFSRHAGAVLESGLTRIAATKFAQELQDLGADVYVQQEE